MVPIHDTDLAQERWAQTEWEHYELWEKLEVKLRRRKSVWIGAAILLFFLLSSVPILIEHWPKWVAMGANRKLSQQINRLKVMAGKPSDQDHRAFRLRFSADHRLTYSIEKLTNCSESSGQLIESGNIIRESRLENYALLSPEQGKSLGIPGLVESICFDALNGSEQSVKDESISGFGIISVKDLAEKRTDRVSILIFKGPSAEPSFE
jgi:hypothetical protein